MPVPLSRALSLRDGLGVGASALRHGPVALGIGSVTLWWLHAGRGLSLIPKEEGSAGFGGLLDALMRPENLPIVLLVGLVQLASFMVRTWIEPGFLRVQRDVIMSGKGSALALIGGVDVFLPMLAVRALNAALVGLPVCFALALLALGLPTLLATLVLTVGVVASAWLLIGLQFATRFVALGEHSAPTALRRSWEMARGNWLALFIYDGALLAFLGLFGYLPGLLASGLGGAALGMIVSLLTWIVARSLGSTALTCTFLLATRETALVYRLVEPFAARLHEPTEPLGRIPAPDEPMTEEGTYPHARR